MTIKDICIHLGISRASYYRWKKNLMKDNPKYHLEKQIGTLCREHKYRYGYRKITAILKKGNAYESQNGSAHYAEESVAMPG